MALVRGKGRGRVVWGATIVAGMDHLVPVAEIVFCRSRYFGNVWANGM